MNLNIVRLGPVAKELSGIRKTLERLAEAYEMDLAERGLHVRAPQADTSGPEPDTLYTDSEMDWLREQLEKRGKLTPEMAEFFDGVPESTAAEE